MSQAQTKKKICLNMIVKNEAKVIERCLASVKSLIDSWVIVDTGSTDGTQDIIRKFLKDIPGEIHERPWKNFSANRNEAIELARNGGDYLLVIDADDVLEVAPNFVMPQLSAESYQICVEDAGTSYWRTHFFYPQGFYYEGVLHEGLMSKSKKSAARLNGVVYRRLGGGARSEDKDKYRKDAAILEEALRCEPTNTRYAFYLAQSWRDAGEFEKAMMAYEHRAKMGGWAEEVYVSLLEVGNMCVHLGRDCMDAYLKAFEFRPTRAESLCNLAAWLREQGRSTAAYPFARVASEIKRPDDLLFVDNSVYAWRALDEYAIASFWMGRYEEGLEANKLLILVVPASERGRVQRNLDFCKRKVPLSAQKPAFTSSLFR
jgi:tetratricopeptide (TPR) repeat protein